MAMTIYMILTGWIVVMVAAALIMHLWKSSHRDDQLDSRQSIRLFELNMLFKELAELRNGKRVGTGNNTCFYICRCMAKDDMESDTIPPLTDAEIQSDPEARSRLAGWLMAYGDRISDETNNPWHNLARMMEKW